MADAGAAPRVILARMDRLEAMRVFARVVERRSFAHAGRDLLLSRSKVSDAVRQLEERLGARLLQRSTRQVVPTAEGEAYHLRCLAILAEVEDAEAALGTTEPRGPLRIDGPGVLVRHFLLPGLPAFLARHPGIALHIGENDRLVDLVREGIDCVLRVGQLASSGLVARKVAMLDECTLASPAYLAAQGTPRTLDELEGHEMIGFVSSATGAVIPLEFQTDRGLRQIVLPTSVTVSSTMLNVELARQGLGLIQVPRYSREEDLAAGHLVEVLPAHRPTPSQVSILYPEGRQLSSRARVFMEWVAERFQPRREAKGRKRQRRQ
jgi:DNA-binding transcriptional LysR family regulator